MQGKISEINIFTVGDSSKLTTWSNVPYFFTENLMENGIKINRIDLSPSRILQKAYNLSIGKTIKLIFPDTSFDYFRSIVNYLHMRARIKFNLKKYNKAQVNIFLTFSFSSSGLSKIPCVNYCDWTYHYYLDFFLEREPDFFEKKSIKREDRLMKKSDIVVTFYPGIRDYLKNRYKKENTFYFGNFINAYYKPDKEYLTKKKSNSYELLFIGTRKYYEGATNLMESYRILKKEYPELKLNIIGMVDKDFSDIPSGVTCYGYLDKSKEEDRKIFYSLLSEAKVLINTTPKWGGFSSINEALYFYTPIIVFPFPEFKKTFGNEIDFGYICTDSSVEELIKSIKMVLTDRSYFAKSIKANEVVKEFEWQTVTKKFLNKTELFFT